LFESKNLCFRRFEITDAPVLFEHHLEPELKEWIPNEVYEDLDDTKDAINFYQECVDNNELPFVLAIELKETNHLIGDTGVNLVEGTEDEVEIGYSICCKHSGKGYATEAVIAMTNFVVETFGIKTLYGRVMKGNVASVKVMEKAGYQFLKEEYGAEDDPYNRGMLIFKKEVK
ncbi:MAG TPA: GNAT family N-acetyltransferase, partial [Gallicola sp.]|nr:GNAT family N-acetyltransferase [Gallicola sp.]